MIVTLVNQLLILLRKSAQTLKRELAMSNILIVPLFIGCAIKRTLWKYCEFIILYAGNIIVFTFSDLYQFDYI